MVDFGDFIFDCIPTVTDIKLLSDIIFGQDYLTENQLSKYLNNPEFIVTTLCHKNRFIGVSIQQIATLSNLDSRIADLLFSKFHWDEHQKLIIHKQVFLANAYQGMGLGKALLEHAETKVQNYQLPQISMVWNYKGNKIIPLFEKSGYKQVSTIHEFWKQDSIENKYSCNICGHPCKCDALLMVKFQ